MATQTTTTLVDDIDGSAATDTHVFGLDGTWYEIDLNDKNAKKLNDALTVFIAAARRGEPESRRSQSRQPKAKTTRSASRPSLDREQTTAIRDWARSQGMTVSDRGRLAQTVIDQYEAAH